MTTTNPPSRLQIAQILADLSDLNEPPAALALVTAHLNLSSNPKRTRSKSKPALSMSSSHLSQDGRRRSGITPPSAFTPGTLSRSLSRNDSSGSGASMSAGSSRYQTPSPDVEADPDLERATTLMHLYEIRGRLKQQESGSLARARANVEAVAERYGRLRDGTSH